MEGGAVGEFCGCQGGKMVTGIRWGVSVVGGGCDRVTEGVIGLVGDGVATAS